MKRRIETSITPDQSAKLKARTDIARLQSVSRRPSASRSVAIAALR